MHYPPPLNYWRNEFGHLRSHFRISGFCIATICPPRVAGPAERLVTVPRSRSFPALADKFERTKNRRWSKIIQEASAALKNTQTVDASRKLNQTMKALSPATAAVDDGQPSESKTMGA